ncbi:MAG: Mth938-like domain-containing protein [Casimicrobiaceae bacterium]
MKFHLQPPTSNIVTGSGPGWVRVGQTEYRQNLLLLPDAVIEGWAPDGFAALAESDFAALLAHAPETVLLGTGARQLFPHPRLLQALSAAHVGVEVMDTRAACRTFNILVAEDRRVLAALIVAPV